MPVPEPVNCLGHCSRDIVQHGNSGFFADCGGLGADNAGEYRPCTGVGNKTSRFDAGALRRLAGCLVVNGLDDGLGVRIDDEQIRGPSKTWVNGGRKVFPCGADGDFHGESSGKQW